MKWVLLAALCLAACRSGATPHDLATQRVHQGLTRGYDASNAVGPATLQVRYNPAPCECPPYEVFAYGGWTRTFVEPATAELDALRGGEPLSVITVTATIDLRKRAAENGVMYAVLAVP